MPISNNYKKWIWAGSFALAAAGFLLPFWPLSLLGIILAGAGGRFFFAFLLGVLLDLVYGSPPGYLHVLLAPFTFFSILTIAARLLADRYFIEKSPPTRL